MNKKLFLAILIPALLLIGAYLFIRFSLQSSVNKESDRSSKTTIDTGSLKKKSLLDLRPLFIEKLQQLVHKSSNGLYVLSVGDMELDVIASTVALQNVELTPVKERQESLKKDQQLPNDIFKITLQTLAIEGINLDDAITSKSMDYDLIRLVNPVIEVRHKKQKEPTKKGEDFSQRFLKEMEKLSVNKLLIQGATVTHYNDDKGSKRTALNDFSLTMNDILVDSTTRDDKNRFFFAKEAAISFKNFITTTTDGLYDMKIGAVSITSPQQNVSLQNFTFKSKLSREAFRKKITTRKELYELSMPAANLEAMDWWSLLNEEKLEAKEMVIANSKLSVYLDRSDAPISKMGNFPNQLIMKLPMAIDVGKINMKNMEVAYTEYNPISQQEGTVELDRINMIMSNVTNIKQNIVANKNMKVTGTARFMKTVPMRATFIFDLQNNKKGVFSANLFLDGFDGKKANSFSEPLGLVRVTEGTIQKVDAEVKGNEDKATSEVLILYKDLKLSLLENDKNKKELDKKDITTFLANLLVIKDDNPKGDKEPRRERGEFTRNPKAGFLNLVWKAVLVGLLKTVGAPQKLAAAK